MLYLVSTPIGNLGDLSDRAKTVLQSVDLIACEDTRTTKQLLTLLGLKIPPLTAYHEHNAEQAKTPLIEKLKTGLNIALVSDAGTPLISDPGWRILERKITYQPETEDIAGTVKEYFAEVIGESLNSDSQIR